MNRYLLPLFAIALLHISCSKESKQYSYLQDELKKRVKDEQYLLNAIQASDTVLLSNFKLDLQSAIREWNEMYRNQFLKDFDLAYSHFSQDHVQHLHEQRLDIQSLNDSITLIHEHANSFINEEAIEGLYLNHLSTLLATAAEIDSLSSDILWFTIDHNYRSSKSGDESTEKLFYFPNDQSFLDFDPVLDHIAIYNLHKFQLRLR